MHSGWLLFLLASASLAAETPLRILFIGNSYTYFNHLAGLVEGIAAASGGRPVEARSVTRGGATLEQMYTSTLAREVLHGDKWDLVVLQEQSTLGVSLFNGDLGVNLPAAFHTWARIWDSEIRAHGARTVFYNTWARKGRPEQQGHLDWSYAAIAKELGAGLIPVGAAFQRSIEAHPDIELYAPDGSHPSAAGSYLAACTTVEILTGHGCAGAPETVSGIPMDNRSGQLKADRGAIVSLPPQVAQNLQTAAIGAVRQLQAEGGYWLRPQPVFAAAPPPLSEKTAAPAPLWQGRWQGTSWFYGQKSVATLQLNIKDNTCTGTWSISVAEPPTQATMPLANCTIAAGRLRFIVNTLFLTSEAHEAVWTADGLVGNVQVLSRTPYFHQSGTWTLQRASL